MTILSRIFKKHANLRTKQTWKIILNNLYTWHLFLAALCLFSRVRNSNVAKHVGHWNLSSSKFSFSLSLSSSFGLFSSYWISCNKKRKCWLVYGSTYFLVPFYHNAHVLPFSPNMGEGGGAVLGDGGGATITGSKDNAIRVLTWTCPGQIILFRVVWNMKLNFNYLLQPLPHLRWSQILTVLILGLQYYNKIIDVCHLFNTQ